MGCSVTYPVGDRVNIHTYLPKGARHTVSGAFVRIRSMIDGLRQATHEFSAKKARRYHATSSSVRPGRKEVDREEPDTGKSPSKS